MKTIAFRLDPLDMLFFRGGKPFGATDRVASGLPKPQTPAGALRTWMLKKAECDFKRLGSMMRDGASFEKAVGDLSAEFAPIADVKFRGPWFCRDGLPLIPVPPTLKKVEDGEEIVRLDTLKSITIPGWKSPEGGMLPLWRKNNRPMRRLEGFLSLAGLKKYCEGGAPGPGDVIPAGDLYEIETRTGIGVDPDSLSAADSHIYAVGMLALKQDVCLYVEVDAPESVTEWLPGAGDTLPLGGEGRRVNVEPVKRVEWPSANPSGDEQGAMLILTSPGLFNGWKPKKLNGSLVSAAVGGYEAVSGWDMAKNGPKPNRFAVNAGSVYFVDRDPEGDSLCSGEDAKLGYGTFVKGIFNYV